MRRSRHNTAYLIQVNEIIRICHEYEGCDRKIRHKDHHLHHKAWLAMTKGDLPTHSHINNEFFF